MKANQETARDIWQDFKTIASRSYSPDNPIQRRLKYLGFIIFLIPLGALLGFRYAYKKLRLQYEGKEPWLTGQPKAVYSTMIVGAVLAVILPVFVFWLFYQVKHHPYSDFYGMVFTAVAWVIVNWFLTMICFASLSLWRSDIFNYITETSRYGTARFAKPEEVAAYFEDKQPGGLYVGYRLYYKDEGHIVTCAGTRGGKGVNLLLPNLLKLGHFQGSFVVIDPKGENAAVSADYQRSIGRNVVMLNPWDILGLGSVAFNPLDILKIDRLNLTDDVQMVAESIVPMKVDRDDHFDERARSLISGLLLHLVTEYDDKSKTLATLWGWLRLPDEQWKALLKEMTESTHPDVGDIVKKTADEVLYSMEQGAREFASVMSTARKHTDFIKSPALRDSLANGGFKSADLVEQNTIVYLIIPADRLKSQPRWLRLVVTALMRSVVRNPGKRDVCFMLDEFYSLGYLSEIQTAMGLYAGFGIHVWAVLQNLVQLQEIYGNSWQNFIGNASVKHYFNIDDNFSADYISHSMGTYSVPSYNKLGELSGSTGRNLLNADELMNQSGETIYTRIDKLHPIDAPKVPYFDQGLIEGKDYNRNPYFKG